MLLTYQYGDPTPLAGGVDDEEEGGVDPPVVAVPVEGVVDVELEVAGAVAELVGAVAPDCAVELESLPREPPQPNGTANAANKARNARR